MAKENNIRIEEESQKPKRCSKCKEIKPVGQFNKDKSAKSGYRAGCKECGKLHRIKTKEQTKVYKKKYYKEHQEQIKAYNEKNEEQIKESIKAWYQNNKEKAREYSKEYRKQNQERLKQDAKEYAETNKEKIKVYKRHHQRKRASTLKGKLNARMSARLRAALLKGKQGKHWGDLVGYNVNDLIKHLKKKLPAGVTWENVKANPENYQIDHIIPVAVFNYQTTEDIDFQKCWALSNLQILSKQENLIKWCKIDKPFQPSLAFNV